MKKFLSALLSVLLIGSFSLMAFADEAEPVSNDIVQYEDFCSDGDFAFTNGFKRVRYDGSFTFEGNQIVSTKFKVAGTSTTISAKATTTASKKDYTIELYQGIDDSDSPSGYRSVAKYTYKADGTTNTHTYNNIKSGRTLYFVIKYSAGLFETGTVSGYGTVSNYLAGGY